MRPVISNMLAFSHSTSSSPSESSRLSANTSFSNSLTRSFRPLSPDFYLLIIINYIGESKKCYINNRCLISSFFSLIIWLYSFSKFSLSTSIFEILSFAMTRNFSNFSSCSSYFTLRSHVYLYYYSSLITKP